MSDTPRTDSQPIIHRGGNNGVPIEFCRQLERELTDAKVAEIGALMLVAKIRAELGDPEGKLTQDELLSLCRNLRTSDDRSQT